MSHASKLISAAAVLGIALSLACGSHPMPTGPLDPSIRTQQGTAAVAPVGAPEQSPSAPGGVHGPSNEPPSVRITSPQPNILLRPTLPQHTTVHWTSEDPDGPGPGPKRYFYKILSEDDTEFSFFQALIQPDSLRRFYSPDYPGWTEVSGKVTSFTLPELLPNTHYMFVVQAVDRRGNEDVVWSFSKNMLVFDVAFAAPASATAGADGEPQAPASDGRVKRR